MPATLKLPKQVQDAVDKADKAISDSQAAKDTAPAVVPEPEEPKESTPQDVVTPPEGTPEAEPTPEPAPPKDEDGKGREDWKAKYHTLQGMFNAEVPRLHRELKAANARIEELTANKQKAPDETRAQPQDDAVDSDKLAEVLTESVGPEAADAIMRLVNSRATKDDITPLVEKVDTANAASSQAAFSAALDRKVPEWRTVDNDPAWLAWLGERERFARKTRQDLIAEAYRDGDVDGVAAFFDAFKAGNTVPEPKIDERKAALERQVTPPVSGSTPPTSADKRQWTKAEIAEFYKGVALGKYPADKAALIEQDIMAAGAEGRIR